MVCVPEEGGERRCGLLLLLDSLLRGQLSSLAPLPFHPPFTDVQVVVVRYAPANIHTPSATARPERRRKVLN